MFTKHFALCALMSCASLYSAQDFLPETAALITAIADDSPEKIMLAVEQGANIKQRLSWEAVKNLINKSSDFNEEYNDQQLTPVDIAYLCSNYTDASKAIKTLLKMGAQISKPEILESMSYAYSERVWCEDYLELVYLLLKQGAKLSFEYGDQYSWTLYVAIRTTLEEESERAHYARLLIQEILHSGYNINDQWGFILSHYENTDIDIFKKHVAFIIDNGADINCSITEKSPDTTVICTPLFGALRKKQKLQALLDAGANPNIPLVITGDPLYNEKLETNLHGTISALRLAQMHGKEEIVDLLKAYGATL